MNSFICSSISVTIILHTPFHLEHEDTNPSEKKHWSSRIHVPTKLLKLVFAFTCPLWHSLHWEGYSKKAIKKAVNQILPLQPSTALHPTLSTCPSTTGPFVNFINAKNTLNTNVLVLASSNAEHADSFSLQNVDRATGPHVTFLLQKKL